MIIIIRTRAQLWKVRFIWSVSAPGIEAHRARRICLQSHQKPPSNASESLEVRRSTQKVRSAQKRTLDLQSASKQMPADHRPVGTLKNGKQITGRTVNISKRERQSIARTQGRRANMRQTVVHAEKPLQVKMLRTIKKALLLTGFGFLKGQTCWKTLGRQRTQEACDRRLAAREADRSR